MEWDLSKSISDVSLMKLTLPVMGEMYLAYISDWSGLST